jgi:hypothetical protein
MLTPKIEQRPASEMAQRWRLQLDLSSPWGGTAMTYCGGGAWGGRPLWRPAMRADLTIGGEDKARGWSCELWVQVERERVMCGAGGDVERRTPSAAVHVDARGGDKVKTRPTESANYFSRKLSFLPPPPLKQETNRGEGHNFSPTTLASPHLPFCCADGLVPPLLLRAHL